MSVLSLCSTASSANTGRIDCDTSRGIPQYMIIGSNEFAASDYATASGFKSQFIAGFSLPNGDPDKLFPLPLIQNVTNNTEAPTTATAGLGFTVTLRSGKPAFSMAVFAGTNLEKKLESFNGQTLPIYILDNASHLWGVVNSDGTFRGAKIRIEMTPKPWSDGNSIESLYTIFNLSWESNDEYLKNAAFVTTDMGGNDFEGLIDVQLRLISGTSNVRQIAVEFKNADLGKDLNIYAKYPTSLAAAGLWEAFSDAGALTTPLAITSVAANAGLLGYTVTFDTTAYNTLPANQKIKLQLKNPTILKAAGVIGIESVPVILTK